MHFKYPVLSGGLVEKHGHIFIVLPGIDVLGASAMLLFWLLFSFDRLPSIFFICNWFLEVLFWMKCQHGGCGTCSHALCSASQTMVYMQKKTDF